MINGFHTIIYSDDAEPRAKGVDVADEIVDEGFGLTTTIKLPGAGRMMLYEPRHDVACDLDG